MSWEAAVAIIFVGIMWHFGKFAFNDEEPIWIRLFSFMMSLWLAIVASNYAIRLAMENGATSSLIQTTNIFFFVTVVPAILVTGLFIILFIKQIFTDGLSFMINSSSSRKREEDERD